MSVSVSVRVSVMTDTRKNAEVQIKATTLSLLMSGSDRAKQKRIGQQNWDRFADLTVVSHRLVYLIRQKQMLAHGNMEQRQMVGYLVM